MDEKWDYEQGWEVRSGDQDARKDKRWPRGVRKQVVIISAFLLMVFYSFSYLNIKLYISSSQLVSHQTILTKFSSCSVQTYLNTGLPWLSTASPLPILEFVTRRNRLAQALAADEIDAFIVESGYTFQYYVNVTQIDWEPWEQEERPFLLIVSPERSGGEVKARTRFLAPAFEVERVRLLGMPFADDEKLEIVSWEEHWNPYSTLLENWSISEDMGRENKERRPKVMVDDEMRDFIQRGLGENGFEVEGLSGEVERVKQTKSEREIEILRAVNTGTVEAIRAMRKCMVPNLTETEVMNVLDETLRAGGLEPFFDIVLFDEDAANPHGGTEGEKLLEKETLVLIDVGTHLHGYSSDISRTFFPPFFPQPNLSDPSNLTTIPPQIQHKVAIYTLIHAAQTASFLHLIPNQTAASVDIAARAVIEAAGYGDAFTHRVGHGIGIKAHESPYLNKGNTDIRLKEGMVFTSEPGVYLVGEFGVRIEDVLLVSGDGMEAEVLSGRRAGDAWDP